MEAAQAATVVQAGVRGRQARSKKRAAMVEKAKGGYGMFDAYARSKLAQVLFAKELQRREDAREGGSPVVSVSLHPGNVSTDVTRDFPYVVREAYKLLQPLLQVVQQSLDEGARTSVFAVASADGDALRGCFLERSTVVPAADGACNEALARRQWEHNERLRSKWAGPLE